jgi:F0F1-type ATP synthase membrane subunit b/b'
MSPRSLARRAALALMALLTAWSVWAWAQQPLPQKAPPLGQPLRLQPPTPPPVAAKTTPAKEAPAAKEAKEEKAGEEGEGPAPFNFSEFGGETAPFLAMLINFGIFAAGFYLFGREPIATALAKRRDVIAHDIEEATRMKLEAEERAKTYQAKLEKLEGEMAAARDALVQAGESERERIVREAVAKAERMRKDAEFLVEQELKQIRIDLWRDTVDAAIRAAEELLKQRVTQGDQERLAEDYLADLGAKTSAVAAAPSSGRTHTEQPGSGGTP